MSGLIDAAFVLDEEQIGRSRLSQRESTAFQFLSDEYQDFFETARKSAKAGNLFSGTSDKTISPHVHEELLAEATTERLELEETNFRGVHLAQAYSERRTILSIEKKERKVLLKEVAASATVPPEDPHRYEEELRALIQREANLREVFIVQERNERKSFSSIEKKQRKVLLADLRAPEAQKQPHEVLSQGGVPPTGLADGNATAEPMAMPDRGRTPHLRALGIVVNDMSPAERAQYKALADLADMSINDGVQSPSKGAASERSAQTAAENAAPTAAQCSPTPTRGVESLSPLPGGPLPELKPTPRHGAPSPYPLAATPAGQDDGSPANIGKTAPRQEERFRPMSEDPAAVSRPENNPHIRGTSSLASPIEEANSLADAGAATPAQDVDPFFLYLIDDLAHTEVVERNTLVHEEYEDRGNLLVDWELEVDELRNDQRWKQQQQKRSEQSSVTIHENIVSYEEEAAGSKPSLTDRRRPSEEHDPNRAHHGHNHAQKVSTQFSSPSRTIDADYGSPSPPSAVTRGVVLSLPKLLAAEMYHREEVAKHYRAVLRMLVEGLRAGRFEAPLQNCSSSATASTTKPVGLPAALSPNANRVPGGMVPPTSPPPLTIASTQKLVMGYNGNAGRRSLSPQLRGATSSSLGIGRNTTSGLGGAGRLDDIAAGVFIPEAHQLGAAQQLPGVAIPAGVPSALSSKSSSSGGGMKKPQLSSQEREMILRKQISHCLNDESIEREMLVHDEVEELLKLEDACKDPVVEVFDWVISGYKQTLRHNRGPAFSIGKLRDRHLPQYMRRSVSRLHSPTAPPLAAPPSVSPSCGNTSRAQIAGSKGYTFSPSPPAVLREVPRDLATSVAGGLVNKLNDFGRTAPSMPKTLSPQPPAGANPRKRQIA